MFQFFEYLKNHFLNEFSKMLSSFYFIKDMNLLSLISLESSLKITHERYECVNAVPGSNSQLDLATAEISTALQITSWHSFLHQVSYENYFSGEWRWAVEAEC